MKRRLEAKQLSFLPGTNTATSYRLKAIPRQDEEKFMRQLQEAAALLGLPSVHISYYCGNKFYDLANGKAHDFSRGSTSGV